MLWGVGSQPMLFYESQWSKTSAWRDMPGLNSFFQTQTGRFINATWSWLPKEPNRVHVQPKLVAAQMFDVSSRGKMQDIDSLSFLKIQISETTFSAAKAGLSWDELPVLAWDVGMSESCQQISSLTHTERRWLSISPSLPVEQAIRHMKFHLAKTFLCDQVRNHIDMDFEVSDEIATQTWMIWA